MLRAPAAANDNRPGALPRRPLRPQNVARRHRRYLPAMTFGAAALGILEWVRDWL